MYNTELPNRAELPSSRQLLRSTAWAALVAIALLVTAVLPAEYGIDPTGIGRVLGLTRMGEIKMSLAREAAKVTSDEAAAAAAQPARPAATPVSPVPGIAAAPAVPPLAAAKPAAPATLAVEAAKPATAPVEGKSDVVSLTLKPGQAAEVKLDMRKGASVDFQWSATGGTLNVDAHGDPANPPKGFYHGYGKGNQLTKDAGKLVAAFDGQHGWFWRNRSSGEVTLKLNTQGQYTAIKRVL